MGMKDLRRGRRLGLDKKPLPLAALWAAHPSPLERGVECLGYREDLLVAINLLMVSRA